MKDMLKYFFRVWLAPALVTSIPLWMAVNKMSNHLCADFFEMGPSFPIHIKLLFYNSFLLALAQFNRFISIVFQDMLHGTGLNTCAVEMVMWNNKRLLVKMKKDIHAKLLAEYGIKALSKKGEKRNKKLARKILLRAVLKVNGKEPDPKAQHYALEWVAVRHLIGGCITACGILIGLLVASIVQHNEPLIWKSAVLLVMHGIPVLFSRSILRWFAFQYAQKFWERYVYGGNSRSFNNSKWSSLKF